MLTPILMLTFCHAMPATEIMTIESIDTTRVFAAKYGNRVHETLTLVGKGGKQVKVELPAYHDRFGHYPQYGKGMQVQLPSTNLDVVKLRREQVRVSG